MTRLREVPLASQAFFRGLGSGYSLLTSSERGRASLLAASVGVNSFLQTVALAGIVPFVQVMMEPERSETTGWMRRLREGLGLDSAEQLMMVMGFALLALVMAKNLYAWFHIRAQNRFGATCETRLGTELLRGVLNAPYGFTLTQNSAVIREIILGHAVQWSRGFIRAALMLCNNLLFTAMVMVLLIYSSPSAGLVVCAVAAGLAWAMFRITRPMILRYSEAKRLAIQQASVVGTQAVAGVKEVKMTAAEPFFEAEFSRHFRRYSFSEAGSRIWQAVPRLGIEVIGYGTLIAFSLVAVGSGAARGDVAGVIALYALAIVRILPVLTNVVSSLGTLMSSLPFIGEIQGLRAAMGPGEGVSEGGAGLIDWRTVVARDLGYRYPSGDGPALRNVNLTLMRGGVYGVVGPSGAGKSTLIDLLAGLLEPTDGAIEIDGWPLDGVGRLWWRVRVGYVAQAPFILDGTLRENIAFGVDEGAVDRNRLDEAIEAAHLRPLMRELPRGLDTELGERGVRLSGGQRQRVAIARALYRDVDILILDEATSALDSLSEREVTEAIARLAGKLTIVVIAHRLATVTHCGEIWVLDQGRVVGVGDDTGLLESCPLYRRLVEAQFGAIADAANHRKPRGVARA